MKRICALIAVVWVMVAFCPSPGSAQSEKDGIAVFNQANELRSKARSKEDMEKAQAKYQQALEIFGKVNSDKWQVSTLTHMGAVCTELSQFQKALEYYEKALALQRKNGNVQSEGWIRCNMGTAYERLGQYQKSLESAESALSVAKKIGNIQLEGEASKVMGLAYSRLGEYQKSLEFAERALDIGTKTANARGAGNALSVIGTDYKQLGQYRKALEAYEKAVENHTKAGAMLGEGYNLANIGSVYQILGEYQKSLEYYNKSLALELKIGSHHGEGATLREIASVYSDLGQYQKALEYSEKALEIQQRIDDAPGVANSLSQMGKIYYASGQRQKALEHYEKSLEIRKRIGSQNGEAISLNNIGRVYFGLGKYDDALRNYQRALEIWSKIGSPTDEVKALMAWTYLEKGALANAEDLLKGTESSWALGKLHLLKAEYNKAKTDYEKLLASAEKSGNINNLFTAYTGLGEVYESLENYKKAEEYYGKGMKLTEELRSSLLPSERKDFFELKIQGFERSEPAKGLTRVKMKLNQAAGSIDSSEVTRARTFSDNISIRSGEGYSGVPRQIIQKEDELVSKVAALKKELAKTEKEKAPAKYENINKAVQEAEAELNIFIDMLWNKYKPYASVKHPRPVTLKESALKPEEYVVIFDVSDEGVGVKLINGREIVKTDYTKWKSEDLEKDVKKFRQAFEDVQDIKKLKEFDPELGKSLYKNLLAAGTDEGSGRNTYCNHP